MALNQTGFQLSGLESTPDLVVGEITDATFINQLLAGEPTGDRREAADRCRSVGLQYGAVGTVEQLYGSVDQNAYLFVFPIPFLWLFGFRNDKSDPLGVIDLQFEIFECQTGKVVYRRRLHGQQRYPKQTPSDAVRLTLRDVLEQLANETRSP